MSKQRQQIGGGLAPTSASKWGIFAALLFVAMLLGVATPALAQEKVTLIVTNAQGTVVATMTPQGEVTYTAAYRPYGKKVHGAPLAGPGYTGHVMDPASGLVYMQQRYYDPAVGRFISPDPVVPVAGNVFKFNRYVYAKDSPLVNIDPDGRNATAALGGLFVESWHFVTGRGFNGSRVYGALKDGYNGKGAGRLHAALQDLGTLSIAAGGAGALRGLGKLALKDVGKVAVRKVSNAIEKRVGRAALKTTSHGAERLAGKAATRGGVLSAREAKGVIRAGRTMTQGDGATVHIVTNSAGRSNIVISGDRGVITTFKNISQKSLNRLAKRYEWKK